MILHVPSKLTVLQTTSAHPRTYCLAPLGQQTQPKKKQLQPRIQGHVRTVRQDSCAKQGFGTEWSLWGGDKKIALD